MMRIRPSVGDRVHRGSWTGEKRWARVVEGTRTPRSEREATQDETVDERGGPLPLIQIIACIRLLSERVSPPAFTHCGRFTALHSRNAVDFSAVRSFPPAEVCW
jgi:hypothetical protein